MFGKFLHDSYICDPHLQFTGFLIINLNFLRALICWYFFLCFLAPDTEKWPSLCLCTRWRRTLVIVISCWIIDPSLVDSGRKFVSLRTSFITNSHIKIFFLVNFFFFYSNTLFHKSYLVNRFKFWFTCSIPLPLASMTSTGHTLIWSGRCNCRAWK